MIMLDHDTEAGVKRRTSRLRPPGCWRAWLIGPLLPTAAAPHQTVGKTIGLAVFASDVPSSTAYATQEVLLILAAAGVGAFGSALPISWAIVGLLAIITFQERVPSVVSQMSLATGLIYTYTKDFGPGTTDAWYFTAIDFRTGATAFKQLAGTGLLYNNDYAGLYLGPDGTAYIGVLGGLVTVRDGE